MRERVGWDVERRLRRPPEVALGLGDLVGAEQAADVLRPTYDATDGGDGLVSMEVSPYLAHDTRATIA